MAVWEMIRASGIIAYTLLTVSVAVGMAVRLRALDWLMRRTWVLESHQTTSVLALAFTGGHAILPLLSRSEPFTVAQIFVPFVVGWKPLAVGLGILSLYATALLVATSYVRPFIGYRTWRAIHYGAFAGWVLALVHGVWAGTDTGDLRVQYMYLVSGTVVGALMLLRMLSHPSERDRAPTPPHRDEIVVPEQVDLIENRPVFGLSGRGGDARSGPGASRSP